MGLVQTKSTFGSKDLLNCFCHIATKEERLFSWPKKQNRLWSLVLHLSYFSPRTKSAKQMRILRSQKIKGLWTTEREAGSELVLSDPIRPAVWTGLPILPPIFVIIIPLLPTRIWERSRLVNTKFIPQLSAFRGKMGKSSSSKRSNAYENNEHRVRAQFLILKHFFHCYNSTQLSTHPLTKFVNMFVHFCNSSIYRSIFF